VSRSRFVISINIFPLINNLPIVFLIQNFNIEYVLFREYSWYGPKKVCSKSNVPKFGTEWTKIFRPLGQLDRLFHFQFKSNWLFIFDTGLLRPYQSSEYLGEIPCQKLIFTRASLSLSSRSAVADRRRRRWRGKWRRGRRRHLWDRQFAYCSIRRRRSERSFWSRRNCWVSGTFRRFHCKQRRRKSVSGSPIRSILLDIQRDICRRLFDYMGHRLCISRKENSSCKFQPRRSLSDKSQRNRVSFRMVKFVC